MMCCCSSSFVTSGPRALRWVAARGSGPKRFIGGSWKHGDQDEFLFTPPYLFVKMSEVGLAYLPLSLILKKVERIASK